MKVKRQNHSIVFRSLVLVLVFALAILCAPVDGFVALAQMSQYTDYSFMTIGKTQNEEEVKTTVTQGDKYQIVNAYIGGEADWKVGDTSKNNQVMNGMEVSDPGSVQLVSSSVKVFYNASLYEETSTEEDSTGKVVVTTSNPKSYGYFVADKIGTYTIRYSYQYKIGDKTYTNSYDLRVESKLADASMNFENNDPNFLPSIYDLALAKDGEGYKNLHIPTPSLTDEDGEEIKLSKDQFVFEQPSDKSGNYVVVTAIGGASNDEIALEKDVDGNMYIKGETFALATEGASTYTVKYSYYVKGQFVTSTTKKTTVYAENDAHYTKYKLDIKLASDWTDNGETGVEKELPKAIAVTGKDTKPSAGEQVDSSYVVRVYHKAQLNDQWQAITKADYNTADETIVVDDNGTLKDASKFKPLKDGYYTFEYEVTDAYGNTAKIGKGVYVYEDIKDEQKPTPIVVDASTDSKEDVSHKLASRAVPNGIIVYSIGIEDNVSKAEDEGVELVRKIMTDETVTKLTIDAKYSKYNLIFNYRPTTAEGTDAWNNLKTNNKKALQNSTATDDKTMLEWLNSKNFKIVVDKANYETIYKIFSKEGMNVLPESVTDKETALDFFKSEEALTAGFAYIESEQTFGASTSDGGMGNGQYYIHYIAKDKAGNERDLSKPMYVTSFVDDDAPSINFATTLSGYYLPTATITFDVPTANDNGIDTNMQVRTFYRFLDAEDKAIEVEDADKSLAEVFTDFSDKMEDGKLLTEKYKEYNLDKAGNFRYVELTDKDASSYKIKLADGTEKAKKLQIFAYAYDDSGNVGVYAQTLNILNVVDDSAPILATEELNGQEFTSEYMQDDEIEIPEISVYDDQVEYVDFDIKVYYGEEKEVVSTYLGYADRQVLNSNGGGKFTVKGAKFTAGSAGDYQAVVTIKDSKNNTVVSFVNYTVASRTIISQPAINDVSLTDQTIELDDYFFDANKVIELPTPKISYQIPNSISYDAYSKLTTAEQANYSKVVRGVDANGAATNYSTTRGFKNFFRPTKVEDVQIQYTATVEVYDRAKLRYEEFSLEGNAPRGGVYVYNEYGITITVLSDGSLRIANNDEKDIIVSKNADGSYNQVPVSGDNYEKATLDQIFDALQVYKLKSSTYTIKVKDTKIFDKALRYDYEASIPMDSISSDAGYDLTIKAIQAQDASEIDMDKSYVELRWSLANGTNSSKRWTGLAQDEVYNIKSTGGETKDGTYTVTYYIYDKAGNSTSKAYEIAVGDNIKPTLKVEDDFVKTSYEIGTELIIDRSLVSANDASGIEEITYTLKNTSTDETINLDDKLVSNSYKLNLDKVGSYKLTVTVKDKVGNTTTEDFEFEVTAKSKDSVMTYKVVGTILIVISVVVLVGVVVYFIVSKVKLDKELKK